MRRSEKILSKNSFPEGLTWLQKQVVKNTALLEHIINNDLSHLWRWILVLVLLIAGLYGKSFLGG